MKPINQIVVPDCYQSKLWKTCDIAHRPWWFVKKLDSGDPRISLGSKPHYEATRLDGVKIEPCTHSNLMKKVEEIDNTEWFMPEIKVGQIWLRVHRNPGEYDCEVVLQLTDSRSMEFGDLQNHFEDLEYVRTAHHYYVLLHDPFSPEWVGWNCA